MDTKNLSKCRVVLSVLVGLSLTMVACTPGLYSANDPQGKPANASDYSSAQNDNFVGQTTSDTVTLQNPDAVQSVDAFPPQSVDASSNQPGQVGGVSQTGGGMPLESLPVTWVEYKDQTYPFKISYPEGYTISQAKAEDLSNLSPSPLAAIYFQNPAETQANNTQPEIPTFTIRVYSNDNQQGLESYLSQAGLLHSETGWTTKPFQGDHESGISVFSPNYIAPGWFVYFSSGKYIYQLTPLGSDAAEMLLTFDIN